MERTSRDKNEWGRPKQEVTVEVSFPGYVSHFPLTGTPRCGDTYLRNGRPAVDILLGDFLASGWGPGKPELTIGSIAELDALESAVREARAHLALWFSDHRAPKASAA